jgi:hypothetical protein
VVVAVVVGQTTVLGETTKLRYDSRVVTRYPHYYYYTQQQQKTTERSGRSTSDGEKRRKQDGALAYILLPYNTQQSNHRQVR